MRSTEVALTDTGHLRFDLQREAGGGFWLGVVSPVTESARAHSYYSS